MKKIRVTVSDFMFEILKGDAEYFKIVLTPKSWTNLI